MKGFLRVDFDGFEPKHGGQLLLQVRDEQWLAPVRFDGGERRYGEVTLRSLNPPVCRERRFIIPQMRGSPLSQLRKQRGLTSPAQESSLTGQLLPVRRNDHHLANLLPQQQLFQHLESLLGRDSIDAARSETPTPVRLSRHAHRAPGSPVN